MSHTVLGLSTEIPYGARRVEAGGKVSARAGRALRQFRLALQRRTSGPLASRLAGFADQVAQAAATSPSSDLWDMVRADCRREFSTAALRHGSLADAIEWETIKLQSRLGGGMESAPPPAVAMFRERRVHIGRLIHLWRGLAAETEEWLAGQGGTTFLDVGPWGGFNFVIESDGYTRMPFARLTLAMGALPETPLTEAGGPLFDHFLPRYCEALAEAGVTIPDHWQYQFPKWDHAGRLIELSGTYYLPSHTYDRRTFIKVRLSRACETVEEITLQDFLVLLERLHFTTDWALYREQTKDVDARFDLQDFISLNHVVEGVYQRSADEERLLVEIKDAFRGTIKTPAVLYGYWRQVIISRWVENLYWVLADVALGVKRYQRMVSFAREVVDQMPPRLLIPVRRQLQEYHSRLGAFGVIGGDAVSS
ncbi:MAG: hypothetical protein L6Q34_00580 [Nitrospira sp.]|nr:hypothetical protein [Nitrospira sp. NTP2]MCK6491903.1 hypothetical protein [Nitrospira sp.]MEB2339920.1 hypothetical protein [Nitrospirales bacterium]RIK60664.1 MAG: hypothetical protein DCC63_03265 [Nitrospira sp.]